MATQKITREDARSEINNCKSKLSFALSLVFRQRHQYIEPVVKALYDATNDENYLRAFLLNKHHHK